ncbi:MAG TPA: L,D-transpeptidase [Ignavibacteria bacterium]|nr:L,D-transpeptidase [Ignavibacteria bacterium]
MELTTENIYESKESHEGNHKNDNGGKLFSFITPVILALFLFSGFISNNKEQVHIAKNDGFYELGSKKKNDGKINLLSASDINSPIKDTVYTDKDMWLEVRVDKQYVYEHWRDGRVVAFPISSGNKFIHEAVEARPGLFAIFYRNEHHKSTQFSDASLYHFQTFNQGIGFHALDGTGYYGNLGVRPSSHGCIRMRHEDARQLYKDAEMGTLVIAHNGDISKRTVGFAPKGYKQEKEYTKEEYKEMLAKNLYNVLHGNYFTEEREFFVVDPKAIPPWGVYNGYDAELPKRQKSPQHIYNFKQESDRMAGDNVSVSEENIYDSETAMSEFNLDEAVINENEVKNLKSPVVDVTSKETLIKKYYHNPIGILPYYGPKK